MNKTIEQKEDILTYLSNNILTPKNTHQPATESLNKSLNECELFDPQLDNLNENANVVKSMIESRYRRLNTNNRRPSLEYIPSEDILEIFYNFVENKHDLLTMSKIELQTLYDRWFEVYSKIL